MTKNYKNINYFESYPEKSTKIFDDLDKLHDFCRFEMLPFNEADLYNRTSQVWNQYYHSTRSRKPWTSDYKEFARTKKVVSQKNG